jgi:hypothetical protein
MVSPLMRTPTAMMASKAPVEPEAAPPVGREVRSVVDEARRSPAEGRPLLEVDWIWEAEKRLRREKCVSAKICWTNETHRVSAQAAGIRRRQGVPLNSERKLPGAGAGLDDNVGLLDTSFEKLGLGASDEGVDDGRVPASVDDANTQLGAVVLLRGRAFERHGA